MDSMTDVIDGLVDDLFLNKIIDNTDRTRAFLALEDSLQRMIDDFNININFNSEE